jgi:hypothetical protein
MTLKKRARVVYHFLIYVECPVIESDFGQVSSPNEVWP